MTIQAQKVILLKTQHLTFHTKFKIYGWLKAAVKIFTVFYQHFLRYLSSKSSITTDDFSKMCRFKKFCLERVKRKNHEKKKKNMIYNTHASAESCSSWQLFDLRPGFEHI